MVLLGIAVAAMGHHRLLAGIEAGFRGKILRRIGFRAARLALVVEPGRLEHHQVRRLQRHPVRRQRVLDALVLADRPVEHDALVGVLRGARHRAAPQAHALRANQDALRVHAVQDVFEPLAFLADAIFLGHRQSVEEHLVGVHGLAAHFLDLAHLDVFAVEVGIKEREARGSLRQHQDLLGDLRGGDPDLLPRDDVALALLLRHGLDLARIEPRVGLGDREAGALLAGDQPGQHALLLRVIAELDHGIQAEDVHVHCRGPGKPGARFGDRLHHDRRLGDAQARAAVGLRHGDTEPAVLGQRLVQLARKAPLLVALHPVLVRKTRADFRDRLADRFLLLGVGEVHAIDSVGWAVGPPYGGRGSPRTAAHRSPSPSRARSSQILGSSSSTRRPTGKKQASPGANSNCSPPTSTRAAPSSR